MPSGMKMLEKLKAAKIPLELVKVMHSLWTFLPFGLWLSLAH